MSHIDNYLSMAVYEPAAPCGACGHLYHSIKYIATGVFFPHPNGKEEFAKNLLIATCDRCGAGTWWRPHKAQMRPLPVVKPTTSFWGKVRKFLQDYGA